MGAEAGLPATLRALIAAAFVDRQTLRLAWRAGRTSLELRRGGLRPILEKLDETLPPGTTAKGVELAERIDGAFALLPLHPTCLRRSVTLLRELERHGSAAELVIGVRNTSGSVEAHAWVQIGTTVVNDDPEAVGSYTVIATGADLGTLPSDLR